MRKGLGCGAVGDTREDLASSQSELRHTELEGLHTATALHFAD